MYYTVLLNSTEILPRTILGKQVAIRIHTKNNSLFNGLLWVFSTAQRVEPLKFRSVEGMFGDRTTEHVASVM